jgi:hypothetical protein
LTVRARPPESDYVRALKILLKAYAYDGCKPYYFTWKLVKAPSGKVRGRNVGARVTPPPNPPQSRSDANPGENVTAVTFRCFVPPSRRDTDGLTPCWGKVVYQVSVRDSSRPKAKTGSAKLEFYWAPDCISPELRKEAKREREQIANELYKELAEHYGLSWILERVIEYVAAPELAPALFVVDLTAIGGTATKQWQRAEQLEGLLSQPNC